MGKTKKSHKKIKKLSLPSAKNYNYSIYVAFSQRLVCFSTGATASAEVKASNIRGILTLSNLIFVTFHQKKKTDQLLL